MVRKKIPYVSPDISETQVQLESPICSGSVDFKAPDQESGRIEAQQINSDFKSTNDNDYFNSAWTPTTTTGNE